jgi:O-antigen/teichoic acid export membrane protein
LFVDSKSRRIYVLIAKTSDFNTAIDEVISIKGYKNLSIAKLAIWDFGGRVAGYLVVFFVSVVLTRLLSPAEFGAFGLVLSVISLSTVFIDLGLRSAIIQARETTREQLSTIFFINFGMAFGLISLVAAVAEWIESFYQIDGLRYYLIAASLVFALNSLALVPSGLLQKNLELKTISLINTGAALFSGVVAVACAYWGLKVWALIAQQLAAAAVTLIAMTYCAKWLPSFTFKLRSIGNMWRYGWKLLLSGILDTVFTRLDVFIIGKLFPLMTLGYYNRAQTLDGFVKNFSASTTTSVAFPLIARMGDDLEKTREFYLRCLNVIAFLSFFLVGILFLTCFDLVILLFTEKWAMVGNYFRIMAVTGFVYPISALMVNVLSARGNSKDFLRLEIIKKAVLFPAYLSFLVGGVYLFLIAVGAAFLIALLVNALFVRREIDVSVKRQYAVILSYGAPTFLTTALVYWLTFYLENNYLHLMASSALFAIFYLALCYQLKLPGFLEIFGRALNFYNDKRHANISSAS